MSTELIKACDLLLRSGKVGEAAKLLRQVNSRRVAAPQRLPLAKLCRRTGLPALGLRIISAGLQENIAAIDYRGREAEVAEYAILLQRLGVADEARAILGRLNAEAVPEVDLYLAFDRVARWDYEGSIPFIEKYLRSPSDGYAKFIGQVNLAAALVHVRRDAEAKALLTNLLHEAQAAGYSRIVANSHGLIADVLIREGNGQGARVHLSQARTILGNSRVHDQIFIRLSEAQLTGRREDLLAVRAEALARREWESAREVDLQLLKTAPDRELLGRLYWGTPFPAYRQRLLKEIDCHAPEPIQLGAGEGPQLCLRTGRLGDLGLTTVVRRALAAMTIDLYRPQPVGAIFSQIFPETHFDIFTSPTRVHQIVKRVRALLIDTKFPLEIACDKGLYSLKVSGQCGVIIAGSAYTDAQVFAARARELLATDCPFTNIELREAVGLKKSQVNELVAECIRDGLMTSFGRGRGTRYRFVSR